MMRIDIIIITRLELLDTPKLAWSRPITSIQSHVFELVLGQFAAVKGIHAHVKQLAVLPKTKKHIVVCIAHAECSAFASVPQVVEKGLDVCGRSSEMSND